MLQIIYTTVFPVKRLNNLTVRVWLLNRFNSENRGIHNEKLSQIKQNSLLLEMLSTKKISQNQIKMSIKQVTSMKFLLKNNNLQSRKEIFKIEAQVL